MNAVYSIIHVTSKENYEKIMKDRYLRPYSSVHGTGIFCLIQKKKDDLKKYIILKCLVIMRFNLIKKYY